MHRPFLLVACLLFAVPCPSRASEADSPSLGALAERLLAEVSAPGLGIAVADAEGNVDVAVAGLRHAGREAPVERDDTFHIGSLTKSMTASIALRLAAAGRLDLDAPLDSLLEDVAIDPGYDGVTFADLLAHRGGIEPLTDRAPVREAAWRGAGDTPRDQRLALVRDVLSKPPATEPGRMAYSNAGYAIAALVMERITDTAWEDLVAEHVFQPLALASAHTGWPWTQTEATTRGHFAVNGTIIPQADTGYSIDGPLAPAGDVSTSVGDLARYGSAHLRALAGDDRWLDPALAARMHRPADGEDVGYGFGWAIGRIDDRPVHRHAGSAGTYYAVLAIFPDDDLSVAVVFDAGDMALQEAADRALEWALTR